MSVVVEDVHRVDLDANTTEDAQRATEAEHSMTLMQAIKTYPKAVGWSILLSTCIVMEGFDLVLINSLYALPAFQRKFGSLTADGTYQVPAAWQTGLSNGALVGEILGLFFAGLVADRFGFKKTLVGALAMVICFIFIVFFAENITMLLIGEILCGIPWGVFQTLTTTYAAEVCPVALRAYLTTYCNLCWVLGQFLSSGVLKGISGRTDAFAYKLPFALQWIWPVPLIIGISLAPESPWWLVRKNRVDDAKKVLCRLTSKTAETDIDKTVSMMIHTNEFEKSASEGTSYMDCFKGVDLRRTEIVSCAWIIQTLCGSAFMGYSTYFYEQAGLDVSNAFSLSLAQYALGAIGTIFSWFLMTKFGRRSLYLYGQLIMIALLLVIGFCSIVPRDNSGAQWAIGSMLLVYTFIYDATIGPICYSIVAEMSSTRLRQKTVVIARNCYNASSIITNILTPRMLNPSAWNWGAKAGFFWAGMCGLCFLWTFFRLPEPKGRTYAELDMLFEMKTSARKFSSTVVDPFATTVVHGDVADEKKTMESTVQIEKVLSSSS